jgi:hypothetical protein
MYKVRTPAQIALLFPVLAFCAGCPIHAQAPSVERIDIIEYGTYTVDRRVQGRDARGINQATATNVQHAVPTTDIPARIGTTFGFRYKVLGKPEQTPVMLRRIVVFPAPGLRPSSSVKPLPQDEFTVQARIGETNYIFYTLEDAFELVPGSWVIEIWQDNRKLAAQSFTLIKADSGGAQATPPGAQTAPAAGEGL